MKNTLKIKLLEAKTRKTLIGEAKILESRLLSIFENGSDLKYFNGLTKKKKMEYSLLFLMEIQNFNKQDTLIKEDVGFADILKKLFGNIFPNVIETAAEPLIRKVISYIGFAPGSFLSNFIVSFLTSRPSELIAAFGDCKKMTKLLMEAFVEGQVMLLQQQFDKTSFFYNSLRNYLADHITEASFIKDIESKVEEFICDKFDSFTENAKDVVEKLKGDGSEPFFSKWFD